MQKVMRNRMQLNNEKIMLNKLKTVHKYSMMLFICTALLACSESVEIDKNSDEHGFSAPTTATIKANKALISSLPFEDKSDFQQVNRGLIAQEDHLAIYMDEGKKVWDMSEFDFIEYKGETGNAPASVNPSLWRQASLNNVHGLFKLQDGIYQIRNYDLANMTIIEGDSGWIIVDPLTSTETASRALLFAQKHLGIHPIKAVLFTHSHIDHFGGIDGILMHMTDREKSQLRLIAPEGFMEEATSENLIAGIAMARRASYMYGKFLPRTERGHVGSGLGKGPAFATFSLLPPTEIISHEHNKLDIDGVPFSFHYVPESEAPAEFIFYLPEHKAFGGAELVSRTMHNVYTLRGAKVRDASQWSQYIEDARENHKEAELYFGSHHWPIWGSENIQEFLQIQSDTYKYIHDQTVRLLNSGYTPTEIAELIELPESLTRGFSNKGYYGTLKHNSKAVYQFYMGWFSGNPATLDPLPEEETAKRYITMMGGVDVVLEKAQQQFHLVDQSNSDLVSKEYRWLAQLLNQVVFASPSNQKAKALLAKVYDQLGYLSESAPWRDFYLSGAYELRHGNKADNQSLNDIKQVLLAMSVDKFFTKLAVSLNAEKAENKSMKVAINFTDINESYLLTLKNSVLRHKKTSINNQNQVDVTVNITHLLFIDLITGDAGLKETLFGDELQIKGSKIDLIDFLRSFDKLEGDYNIIEP